MIRKLIPGFLSSSSVGISGPERYSRYLSRPFDGTRQTNRGDPEYGLELDGQLNKDGGAMGDNKARQFSRGDGESIGTQIEDGESVRGILSGRPQGESIVKTVSVTITSDPDDRGSGTDDSKATRF